MDDNRIGSHTHSVGNESCTNPWITDEDTRASLRSLNPGHKHKAAGILISRSYRPLPSSQGVACNLRAAAANSTVVFSLRVSSTLKTSPLQQKNDASKNAKQHSRRFLFLIVTRRRDPPTDPPKCCFTTP